MRLLAVGDIALRTADGSAPFTKIQSTLNDKDILFGNLETVISERSSVVEKSRSLLTPKGAVTSLREAGFDILNIANNHIFDSGKDGFLETVAILKHNNIHALGGKYGRPKDPDVVIERRGVRVGFLGYYVHGSYNENEAIGLNPIDRIKNENEIRALKEQCDIVVVSLHWGIEKAAYPSPLQIDTARSYIDCGASVILGHHPHVLQAVEQYHGGLIAYSLGNFQFPLFDKEVFGSCRHGTHKSIVLSVEIGIDGVKSHETIPITINDNYEPELADETQRAEILGHLADITVPVSNDEITWRKWFEEIAGGYLSENFNSFKMRIRKYGFKHLLQCVKWLISPFVLRCYLGWVRRKLRKPPLTGGAL